MVGVCFCLGGFSPVTSQLGNYVSPHFFDHRRPTVVLRALTFRVYELNVAAIDIGQFEVHTSIIEKLDNGNP